MGQAPPACAFGWRWPVSVKRKKKQKKKKKKKDKPLRRNCAGWLIQLEFLGHLSGSTLPLWGTLVIPKPDRRQGSILPPSGGKYLMAVVVFQQGS